MKITSLAVVAALAALVSHDALAAQTSSFQVTATVSKTCDITTTALDFGPYDPFAAGDTTVTNASGVTLTCSKGTAWTVALSTGSSLSYADRTMKGTGTNTDVITYNIYVDSGRTQIWGNGTSSVTATGTAPDKNSHAVAMYGKIVAGQDVNWDSYSDTITATVTF